MFSLAMQKLLLRAHVLTSTDGRPTLFDSGPSTAPSSQNSEQNRKYEF